ncbi:hypothetical protein AMTRI_Chr08g206150 [Amborella trichopoda]
MYREVRNILIQPGFGWAKANRMVTVEPAIWDQCTTASLCLYTSMNWRRYLAQMLWIEAMWKGEEIGADVFLKASRHLKTVFLSI